MPIHTTITPTSMTEFQARVFGILTREENLHFSPYEPLPQRQPPFFVPKLQDVQDIVDRLHRAGGAPAPIYMRQAPRILNRMDISVRANPDAMLTIIKADAHALTFVDKSIATPEFFAKVMAIKPEAYDLLPYDLQQNPQIVEGYGKGLLREPRSGFREFPRINPNCPMDIMAQTDVYKECAKAAFLGKSTSVEVPTRFDDPRKFQHGAAIVLMGLIREAAPELDYHAKNKEAFNEVKDKLIEIAMNTRAGGASVYRMACIQQLAEREDLGTFMQNYEKAGWHNYCKCILEDASLAGFSHILYELTQHCPRDIAEQYFDVEKKQFLPDHPIWDTIAKNAEKIRTTGTGDLSMLYLEEIFKDGTAHLYKPFIDLEASIREIAAEYERAKHYELSRPVMHTSDYSYDSRSKFQELEWAESRGTKLLSMLDRCPEYKQIFESEYTRCATMREHYTPEQHEMRRMQQNMFTNPRGLISLDSWVSQIASKVPASEYQQHVDIEGYIKRRTEWAARTHHRKEVEQEITAFKNMLQRTPALRQIAESKLIEMGVKDPSQWMETAQSKFSYSMDTYSSSRNNPSFEQSYRRNTPSRDDGPEIGG